MIGKVRKRPFILNSEISGPASVSALGVMKAGLGLRLVEKFELHLYRQSRRVVALTQSFKDNLIARGIPESKIDVVINGVDLSRYHKAEKKSQARK